MSTQKLQYHSTTMTNNLISLHTSADDIGKDFHTSPMAEDDQMDIDFSTAAKQNVEPAKFGNM